MKELLSVEMRTCWSHLWSAGQRSSVAPSNSTRKEEPFEVRKVFRRPGCESDDAAREGAMLPYFLRCRKRHAALMEILRNEGFVKRKFFFGTFL